MTPIISIVFHSGGHILKITYYAFLNWLSLRAVNIKECNTVRSWKGYICIDVTYVFDVSAS